MRLYSFKYRAANYSFYRLYLRVTIEPVCHRPDERCKVLHWGRVVIQKSKVVVHAPLEQRVIVDTLCTKVVQSVVPFVT